MFQLTKEEQIQAERFLRSQFATLNILHNKFMQLQLEVKNFDFKMCSDLQSKVTLFGDLPSNQAK